MLHFIRYARLHRNNLPHTEQIEASGEVFSDKDDCVVALKRNTYHPPSQFRVQRKKMPHSLYANCSLSMLDFHEVVLVNLVSTTFPIKINRKSVASICVRHFYVMQ
jgi:hypothetical protein